MGVSGFSEFFEGLYAGVYDGIAALPLWAEGTILGCVIVCCLGCCACLTHRHLLKQQRQDIRRHYTTPPDVVVNPLMTTALMSAHDRPSSVTGGSLGSGTRTSSIGIVLPIVTGSFAGDSCKPPAPGMWECARCGVSNANSNILCVSCEALPQVPPPGLVTKDWACPACAFVNMNGGARCGFCGAAREDGVLALRWILRRDIWKAGPAADDAAASGAGPRSAQMTICVPDETMPVRRPGPSESRGSSGRYYASTPVSSSGGGGGGGGGSAEPAAIGRRLRSRSGSASRLLRGNQMWFYELGADGRMHWELRRGRGGYEPASDAWVRCCRHDGAVEWVALTEEALGAFEERQAVTAQTGAPNARPLAALPLATARGLRRARELTFQRKVCWAREQMESLRALSLSYERQPAEYISIMCRRADAVGSTLEGLLRMTQDELRGIWRFVFDGEPGVDAGGITREWFSLATRQLFDPAVGLFQRADVASVAYQFNPAAVTPMELVTFQYVGRFFGRAIFDAQLIDAHFAGALYKVILGLPVRFEDLEQLDAELYRSLVFIKTHSVDDLCLTFSVTNPRGVDVPLVEGGCELAVTDKNKNLYIAHRLRHRLVDSVEPQLAMFLTGLHEVVPESILSIFTYAELELLVCGLPVIDLSDWTAFTVYRDCAASDAFITWFWETVTAFATEQRARLLQFVTGSARVPPGGFSQLTSNDGICLFTIQAVERADAVFPRAHTCFNRLDLPRYSSHEELAEKLLAVVNVELCSFDMN